MNDFTEQDRTPYVGAGEDGARRSARIDREEADTLPAYSERWEQLQRSANRWEDQAHRHVLARLGGRRPDLNEVRMSVGSEAWLAAIALLDLSPRLANDAAQYASWSQGSGRYTYTGEGGEKVSQFHPDAEMDWEAWVTDVDTAGRGWSSTEYRLFQLAAALTVADRTVRLPGVLDSLGSWEKPALDALVQWASGGNNREQPGRYHVGAGGGW